MASGRYTAYFLHAGRPGETHSGQTSGSIGDLQSKRTVLYQNDLYAGYKRILYICRAHTCRRSHRIMECLRESRRNRFPQESAHRNHQAEPSEDYAGFANHPSGFEQRRICPAYFFMADGSHRIAAESKGRNVLIKGQYASSRTTGNTCSTIRQRTLRPSGRMCSTGCWMRKEEQASIYSFR